MKIVVTRVRQPEEIAPEPEEIESSLSVIEGTWNSCAAQIIGGANAEFDKYGDQPTKIRTVPAFANEDAVYVRSLHLDSSGKSLKDFRKAVSMGKTLAPALNLSSFKIECDNIHTTVKCAETAKKAEATFRAKRDIRRVSRAQLTGSAGPAVS